MKFRVTSIASDESAAVLRSVTTRMEDWLNAAVGDGEFGEGLDQLLLIIVSVYDESDRNNAVATAQEKLGSYKDVISGGRVRYLSLAVHAPSMDVAVMSLPDSLRHFGNAVAARLAVPPKRLPRGLDYERLVSCTALALEAYATAEGPNWAALPTQHHS